MGARRGSGVLEHARQGGVHRAADVRSASGSGRSAGTGTRRNGTVYLLRPAAHGRVAFNSTPGMFSLSGSPTRTGQGALRNWTRTFTLTHPRMRPTRWDATVISGATCTQLRRRARRSNDVFSCYITSPATHDPSLTCTVFAPSPLPSRCHIPGGHQVKRTRRTIAHMAPRASTTSQSGHLDRGGCPFAVARVHAREQRICGRKPCSRACSPPPAPTAFSSVLTLIAELCLCAHT
ncbi:hypothetical protein DFH09DRAFT_338816 [Mycena vulgaris]|nr:hypothetical protein DFH09DRAFT_338816 [Mycena vulgaris]